MAGRRPARMAHGEALRIRVIKAVVEDGLSRNEAARIFRVGIASAIRWVTAFEETRRTAPLPTGGDRRSVLKPHRNWLVELRRKENDLTLVRSPSACFARTASRPTNRCCRASLLLRGSASKKTVRASEQDRPDVAERREVWRSG